MQTNPIFNRLEILTGPKVLTQLSKTKVILLGIGGVGSWCAEGLIRNGIGHLTIVDSDVVCVTNINRQLQATTQSVGKSKVALLKERLLDINPGAKITAVNGIYSQDNFADFKLDEYDYIIDAIDSLSAKVDLLARALDTKGTLFSAMGASCKLDPTQIQMDSFWKTKGCPLAKFVRKRLRNRGVTKDFQCVYSEENLNPYAVDVPCGTGNCFCPEPEDDVEAHEWCSSKKQINGSTVHITAIYGFYLTSMVTNHVVKQVADRPKMILEPIAPNYSITTKK